MSDANGIIKGAIRAYDCDSHVEESEETWSEKYWDPQYAGRRPMLIETDEMGNLSFLVDSIAHPRITGPGVALSGGPVSKNGKLSPAWEADHLLSRGEGAHRHHGVGRAPLRESQAGPDGPGERGGGGELPVRAAHLAHRP